EPPEEERAAGGERGGEDRHEAHASAGQEGEEERSSSRDPEERRTLAEHERLQGLREIEPAVAVLAVPTRRTEILRAVEEERLHLVRTAGACRQQHRGCARDVGRRHARALEFLERVALPLDRVLEDAAAGLALVAA